MKSLYGYFTGQHHPAIILKMIMPALMIIAMGITTNEVWLRNGSVIPFEAITITGDTVHLKDGKTEYLLNKKDVGNIVRVKSHQGFNWRQTVDKLYYRLPRPVRHFCYRNAEALEHSLYLIFAAVLLILTIKAIGWCWSEIALMLGYALQLYKTQRYLLRLDDEEKAVLREFEFQNQAVLLLPVNDPIVNRLLHKDILHDFTCHEGQDYNGTLRPVGSTPRSE